ncbi:unnamed protein product, partial [marine sediment metagenome]
MNEGKLPPEVPVEKLKTEHLSKPRNTLLADVFYKAGFIESWGRGTIKIMEKCLEQGLPEPDFVEEHGVMKVVFYKDKFTEDNLKKLGISERQIRAVMYVKGKGKITNKEYRELTGLSDKGERAAILLFGKNPQRFYPASFLKIGKFITETDIQSSDIVEGNLFEQITNALEILRTKYLISKIKFEGIHRREILEYPYEALREAIINALIRRNYLGASSIQIRVYSDRLVIMNEGKLPPEVPVEKLKTEHLS